MSEVKLVCPDCGNDDDQLNIGWYISSEGRFECECYECNRKWNQPLKVAKK